MQVYEYPSEKEWIEILKRPTFDSKSLEEKVNEVLQKVKSEGDKALIEFTEKFDGVKLDQLKVTQQEFSEASKSITPALKKAIKTASENIVKFHTSQISTVKKIETTKGVKCWRKSVGISKVGLYIPGGTAPLFSTILMLALPAKLAKCKRIVLCTPPGKDGKIHPAILYTAKAAGVTEVYKVGGAQAIAAMAFGTESVPQVYKIFGPGNQYVTAAKQLVSREGIAIDMPAGPSEVAVIADKSANPSFIAADLLSQAEHGKDSQVILVTDNKSIVEKVLKEVEIQLEQLPRKDFAKSSLLHSRFIVLKNMKDVMKLINQYAPEHLIIQSKNAGKLSEQVENAGSVFIGEFTPEAAGDYASGTNHTLPTNGYATAYSGVSMDSFFKKITFQEISKEGLKKLGPAIETMAQEEQLDAHKNAVSIRLKKLKM